VGGEGILAPKSTVVSGSSDADTSTSKNARPVTTPTKELAAAKSATLPSATPKARMISSDRDRRRQQKFKAAEVNNADFGRGKRQKKETKGFDRALAAEKAANRNMKY